MFPNLAPFRSFHASVIQRSPCKSQPQTSWRFPYPCLQSDPCPLALSIFLHHDKLETGKTFWCFRKRRQLGIQSTPIAGFLAWCWTESERDAPARSRMVSTLGSQVNASQLPRNPAASPAAQSETWCRGCTLFDLSHNLSAQAFDRWLHVQIISHKQRFKYLIIFDRARWQSFCTACDRTTLDIHARGFLVSNRQSLLLNTCPSIETI